ncbi:MAG: MaoC family dehydratase [Desulfomonilaceae bacterium]|nr:MaoC family dehydratase [Desulfomonilaceae bacterium]
MLPKVGDKASLSRSISPEEIGQFAAVSGDFNPVHVDEEFAGKTRFGGRIAHGMWSASLISAVLGTKLPGPGTIYLSQTLAFKAPVRPGETITATVKVTKVREDKRIVTLHTYCENAEGQRIVDGEAVVLHEEVV